MSQLLKTGVGIILSLTIMNNHPAIRPSPKEWFESKGYYKEGRNYFDLYPGKLVLTSRSIYFIDYKGHKHFDVQLHHINRINVSRRYPSIRIWTSTKKYTVYLGGVRGWMNKFMAWGLIFGILPGLVIYLFLILPEASRGRKQSREWQLTLAKHAIRNY
jgi:hypothetical protein